MENIKKHTHISLLGLIACIMILTACRKFVTVDPPGNSLTSEKVFADSINADATVTGIYSSITQGSSLFQARLSLVTGLLADELMVASSSALNEFQTNNVTPAAQDIDVIWDQSYRTIYDANRIIEGVSESGGIPATAKQKIIAEAKFIRAWYYFNLVNLFRNIPMVTTSKYSESSKIPQSTADEVYQLIVADLREAQGGLPPNYLNNERTRPNAMVATALLAKVYLYLNNFQSAELEATKVIASGSYTPLPAPASAFLKESKETIWQIASADPTLNSLEGRNLIPNGSSILPAYTLPAQLLGEFNSADKRKDAWIRSNTVAGQAYSYPAKYKERVRLVTAAATEYNIIMRLGEIYLIRAEARIQTNRVAEGVADINVVRRRAGLNDLSLNLTSAEAIVAIEKERRLELFCERGNRWFDLIRTHRADAVLGTVKGSDWAATDAVLPIPGKQIALNRNLFQNKGY